MRSKKSTSPRRARIISCSRCSSSEVIAAAALSPSVPPVAPPDAAEAAPPLSAEPPLRPHIPEVPLPPGFSPRRAGKDTSPVEERSRHARLAGATPPSAMVLALTTKTPVALPPVCTSECRIQSCPSDGLESRKSRSPLPTPPAHCQPRRAPSLPKGLTAACSRGSERSAGEPSPPVGSSAAVPRGLLARSTHLRAAPSTGEANGLGCDPEDALRFGGGHVSANWLRFAGSAT
mmetsp:Transcript_77581/g.154061  ORF Transcript_77581/g.154061 Transcript_77581/m.154061 type:complete len:233 (-) Transcript_77581:224-922(-)